MYLFHLAGFHTRFLMWPQNHFQEAGVWGWTPVLQSEQWFFMHVPDLQAGFAGHLHFPDTCCSRCSRNLQYVILPHAVHRKILCGMRLAQ